MEFDKKKCAYCGKKLGGFNYEGFSFIFNWKYGFLPHFCPNFNKCKNLWKTKFDWFNKLTEKEQKQLPKDFLFKKYKLEYKRTCNHCKKKWFVSFDEINNLYGDLKNQAFKDLSVRFAAPALSGGTGTSTQLIKTELAKLEKCPKCSSRNFKEKIHAYV